MLLTLENKKRFRPCPNIFKKIYVTEHLYCMLHVLNVLRSFKLTMYVNDGVSCYSDYPLLRQFFSTKLPVNVVVKTLKCTSQGKSSVLKTLLKGSEP